MGSVIHGMWTYNKRIKNKFGKTRNRSSQSRNLKFSNSAPIPSSSTIDIIPQSPTFENSGDNHVDSPGEVFTDAPVQKHTRRKIKVNNRLSFAIRITVLYTLTFLPVTSFVGMDMANYDRIPLDVHLVYFVSGMAIWSYTIISPVLLIIHFPTLKTSLLRQWKK